MPDFDVKKIREDFPILKRFINGKPLIYFDNAATTQKPQYVLDSVDNYYKTLNSNVHRGVHTLSEEATNEYESAREAIRKYIMPESHPKLFLYAELLKQLISWQLLSARNFLIQEMKLLFPQLSTIPILFPGKCFVKEKMQS